MKPAIHVGRRKRAVAKAVCKDGAGTIKINGMPLDVMEPEMTRLMMMEPVMLADDVAGKVDIDVTVTGGGLVAQAEAARQSIALSLAGKSKKLEKVFNEYDRNMLVSDSRRTEPHKPSRSSAGPRRHKQRSKR